MSLEEYLSLNDNDFQDFIGYEQGFFITQPFTESALIDLIGQKVEEPEEVSEYEDNTLFTPDDLEDLLSSDSFGTC